MSGHKERSRSLRLRDDHAARPRGRLTIVADHIREILKLQPSHYSGNIGGFQEESWFVSLSRCFNICSCSSNMKARVVIHVLRDGVGVWWRTKE